MVSGFGNLPTSDLRQLARRELRAVLDPVSECHEPDRVYYLGDGRMDAASWGIAQGTVEEAIRSVRAVCASNEALAHCLVAS